MSSLDVRDVHWQPEDLQVAGWYLQNTDSRNAHYYLAVFYRKKDRTFYIIKGWGALTDRDVASRTTCKDSWSGIGHGDASRTRRQVFAYCDAILRDKEKTYHRLWDSYSDPFRDEGWNRLCRDLPRFAIPRWWLKTDREDEVTEMVKEEKRKYTPKSYKKKLPREEPKLDADVDVDEYDKRIRAAAKAKHAKAMKEKSDAEKENVVVRVGRFRKVRRK